MCNCRCCDCCCNEISFERKIKDMFRSTAGFKDVRVSRDRKTIFLDMCGSFNLAWNVKRLAGMGYSVEEIYTSGCGVCIWFSCCPTKYYEN